MEEAAPGGQALRGRPFGPRRGDRQGRSGRHAPGVDQIFHFASANRPLASKFSKFVEINVIGTENLLRAFIEANPGDAEVHILYSSSTAVYGYNRTGETITEESKTAPVTPYGESKLMGEHVIKAFASANKRVKYTIFRIGIMYGAGYDAAFNKVFKMLSEGRMKIIGDGSNHLCMINVEDAADAMVLCCGDRRSAEQDLQPYGRRQVHPEGADNARGQVPRRRGAEGQDKPAPGEDDDDGQELRRRAAAVPAERPGGQHREDKERDSASSRRRA